jgi:putative endonuclease
MSCRLKRSGIPESPLKKTKDYKMKTYYVYMMANNYNNVLYIGITNDLVRRVYEHKNDIIKGFTNKYKCHKLVWFTSTHDINAAILTEKRMKKWNKQYKVNLINKNNPDWEDLYDELV